MDEARSRELYNRLREHERRVTPTLVFSRKARTAPLDSPVLSQLRDFLCRTGAWRDHPIDSVELFVASPAPGVEPATGVPLVIGPSEPVFTSVGFGAKGVRDGRVEYESGVCAELRLPSICDALICAVNVSDRRTAPPCHALDPTGGRAALERPGPDCLVLDASPPGDPQCLVLDTPAAGAPGQDPMAAAGIADLLGTRATCYDSYCGGDTCLEENCSSHKCSTNKCSEQFCGDHLCGTKSVATSAAHAGGLWEGELSANADHPFVKELMAYFDGGDYGALEAAILQFVGRNMFARFSNE